MTKNSPETMPPTTIKPGMPPAPTDEEFESVFDLFYPRSHWSTPTFWTCSSHDKDWTIFLMALIKSGLVQLISDQAAIAVCETRHRVPWDWSAEKMRWYRMCANRRGNDDLKSQSWSAYLHMQRRFPDAEIEVLSSPCFLVNAVEKRTAIVPGNGSPRELLYFVADKQVTSLLFVTGDTESEANDDDGFWILKGLCFSDQAVLEIQNKAQLERQELMRLSSWITHEMGKRMEQMLAASQKDQNRNADSNDGEESVRRRAHLDRQS